MVCVCVCVHCADNVLWTVCRHSKPRSQRNKSCFPSCSTEFNYVLLESICSLTLRISLYFLSCSVSTKACNCLARWILCRCIFGEEYASRIWHFNKQFPRKRRRRRGGRMASSTDAQFRHCCYCSKCFISEIQKSFVDNEHSVLWIECLRNCNFSKPFFFVPHEWK